MIDLFCLRSEKYGGEYKYIDVFRMEAQLNNASSINIIYSCGASFARLSKCVKILRLIVGPNGSFDDTHYKLVHIEDLVYDEKQYYIII